MTVIARALPSLPQISIVDARALDAATVRTWQAVQDADPKWASPFLGPGFTMLMARCKAGVRVALLRAAEGAQGFLAFEDDGRGHGTAVGYGYSDYQALVGEPGLSWTADHLFAAANLTRFTFDHVVADQADALSPSARREPSFVVDLPAGYDAYAARLRSERRNQLVQANRKRRALERDLGPVAFQTHVPDPALLDQLLTWKASQWARSGRPDRFSHPWERALMAGLMTTTGAEFAGLLSVLRAGGQVVALHLGLRSRSVWHYWTPAYDPTAARYSPGIVLLDQMLRAAPTLGLRCVDLGKEDFVYKRRLMTRTLEVADGHWECG